MNVFALKGPAWFVIKGEQQPALQTFLKNSIENGIIRFGWNYIDTADLRKLKGKLWQEMKEEEKDCWRKSNFLLGIEKGDWVVSINTPHWGRCVAGQVAETYSFEDKGNEFSDYRHLLILDKSTIVEFDRNDDRVVPIISRKLKLQGGHWRIYDIQQFKQTIENLKTPSTKKEGESVGVFYLKKEMLPLLQQITHQIQETHPAAKLEELIANIFRNIPGVEVDENGKHKGWDTDYGADLIVTYESGLSIIDKLAKQETLVVQVKSYTGQHLNTNAVDQVEVAINEYKADAALIITTAESTDALEQAIDQLSTKLNKPIGLIAGENVARFVLQHGGGIIL